jgi:hypothetical protein
LFSQEKYELAVGDVTNRFQRRHWAKTAEAEKTSAGNSSLPQLQYSSTRTSHISVLCQSPRFVYLTNSVDTKDVNVSRSLAARQRPSFKASPSTAPAIDTINMQQQRPTNIAPTIQ